jgi:hypothetical protein
VEGSDHYLAYPYENRVKRHVRSTARHTIRLQFDISANGFEIRAIQSPKCKVDSTAHQTIHFRLCTALIPRALALISNFICDVLLTLLT